ncbi:response regulator transcription factor [Paraburkholderia phymatum]|uniref:Response regulator transcription factor n=1 Tax=Paraburkholderia phymatum TaxID=148447 RepID=A0ACC6U3I7_9BURK
MLNAFGEGSLGTVPCLSSCWSTTIQKSSSRSGRCLKQKAIAFLSVPDGKVAVATAMQQRPDLIVTDWIMPRVDGVAFCRWLKSRPATDSIPVVMLSAALLPLPAEPPWNVFLSKPVSIERLLGVIVSLLDERIRLFGPFTPARNEPPVTDARAPQRTHPNSRTNALLAQYLGEVLTRSRFDRQPSKSHSPFSRKSDAGYCAFSGHEHRRRLSSAVPFDSGYRAATREATPRHTVQRFS